MAMLLTRRRDGNLSRHVFGGQSGKRETAGVLKIGRIAYRRSRWTAQLFSIFDVNKIY